MVNEKGKHIIYSCVKDQSKKVTLYQRMNKRGYPPGQSKCKKYTLRWMVKNVCGPDTRRWRVTPQGRVNFTPWQRVINRVYSL